MALNDEQLDMAHLRQLAAKCRRLAKRTYDPVTATAFRQMATEYDRLAHQKEQKITIVQAPQRML